MARQQDRQHDACTNAAQPDLPPVPFPGPPRCGRAQRYGIAAWHGNTDTNPFLSTVFSHAYLSPDAACLSALSGAGGRSNIRTDPKLSTTTKATKACNSKVLSYRQQHSGQLCSLYHSLYATDSSHTVLVSPSFRRFPASPAQFLREKEERR